MLIIEDGAGRPDAEAFSTVQFARDYSRKRLGLESISDASPNCDDERLEKCLFAAADYMATIPWYGIPTNAHQSLCWPRRLYAPHDYRNGDYSRLGTAWYDIGVRGYEERYCVGSNVVPSEICIANVLLAKDIHEGDLDPTGFHKPVLVHEAKGESGEIKFSAAQALSNKGGMQVRTRDPLYAVRRHISQWMYRRPQGIRLMRA